MNSTLIAGDTVALVANSDPLAATEKPLVANLTALLNSWQLQVKTSPLLFSSSPNLAVAKARLMNQYFADHSVKAIFDLSGGNLANTILPFLDYALIRQNPKLFCGYSDLSTILNALQTRTQLPVCLFQIKTLVQEATGKQQQLFYETFFKNKANLFQFDYSFLRGSQLNAEICGGNLRCFLKLAGTPFFPELKNKLLFIESYSGQQALLLSQFSQLSQLPHFNSLAGIMLGTFTKYEQTVPQIPVAELLLTSLPAGATFPIIQTSQIGHAVTSRALFIGTRYVFG
ncbi:LD-carboxypeptidase [Liquorilactobacillus satsumensis]|uniref:Ld-carboxypeptidase n=1 Tax=Liquorilactobacillus satsumensis DSM 16230 = JCM 12392 TaxID=1423801 RepID=A0A0R1V4W6_9LACO|nr:LD-carboxypeptidase [Liquorilactobacillus satsumensis]KRL96747.1 ld-carboxypeptidase [Liquorilactobacillus satsumensis DSM 16230 = JCM 12392]MCC7666094.1 LD-carboxypeptidase [Liquorilactobacillus satsumensis]MCP9312547.1 LD-carboxypeptidase [Liquorilactobacillus satsumensis]MCP9328850.1 LD-carboxypeptidase [Liquorilactobacillus satsumensis]MCP9356800.1 LD-carboxypeptidase [Liquorilactobacillus satsumensis]